MHALPAVSPSSVMHNAYSLMRGLKFARPALASAYEWKKHVSLSTVAPVRVPPHSTDSNPNPGEEATRLQRTLCYACHTTFTSRGAKSSLDNAVEKAPMPVWTIRDEIKEFLLDDDQ